MCYFLCVLVCHPNPDMNHHLPIPYVSGDPLKVPESQERTTEQKTRTPDKEQNNKQKDESK